MSIFAKSRMPETTRVFFAACLTNANFFESLVGAGDVDVENAGLLGGLGGLLRWAHSVLLSRVTQPSSGSQTAAEGIALVGGPGRHRSRGCERAFSSAVSGSSTMAPARTPKVFALEALEDLF